MPGLDPGNVLATSFADTKVLPSKPDMSQLLTEAFLPTFLPR